jgi:hypothetical protein
MKTYVGVDVEMQVSLTSALVGGMWLDSCPCHFNPMERIICTHCIGSLVGCISHVLTALLKGNNE